MWNSWEKPTLLWCGYTQPDCHMVTKVLISVSPPPSLPAFPPSPASPMPYLIYTHTYILKYNTKGLSLLLKGENMGVIIHLSKIFIVNIFQLL